MALTKPRAYQIYDIDYKQATRAVTVANITLAGGAPALVDGVNLVVKDRVLVTGQLDAKQNGIYIVQTVGSGSNGTWVRSDDTNSTGELLGGTIVMVTEGTVYADTQWKLTTNDPIVIGTSELVFVQNYSANSISAGSSNVVVTSNANVTISSAGTANVLTISDSGAYVTGIVSATGNITASNIITSGSGGNITGANTITANIFSASGNITGSYILGNGSQLTGLPAGYANSNAVSYGETGWAGNIIPSANATYSLGDSTHQWKSLYVSNTTIYIGDVPIATSGNTLTVAGNTVLTSSNNTSNVTGNLTTTGYISATGNITGSYILGNGSQITGLPAGYANSDVAAYLASGTVSTDIKTTATLSASGNVSGGNILTAGILSSTGNITSGNILTAGILSSTGNVSGGNILTAGIMSSTGNATHGNISTAGLISATSNITGGNILTAGIMSSTGNATHGNILTSGLISATSTISAGGNIQGANVLVTSYFLSATNNSGLRYPFSGSGTWNIYDHNTPLGGFKTINFGTGQTGSTSNTTINIGTQWGTSNTTVYGNLIVANTITSLSTGSANFLGNITGANLLTGGLISATGNATAGNLVTSGLVSAGGNVIGNNISANNWVTSANVSVSGNILAAGYLSVVGNLYVANVVSTANLVVDDPLVYFNANTPYPYNYTIGFYSDFTGGAGNTYQHTAFARDYTDGVWKLVSNIPEPAGSSLNFTDAIYDALKIGPLTATTGSFSSTVSAAGNVTGSYIIGNGSTLSNITGGNVTGTVANATYATSADSATTATTAGTVTTAAQPNITSVGTLTSVTVTGNTTSGNLLTGGLISATGNATAGNILTAGQVSATGNVTGNYIIGNGSQLTGLPASYANSNVASYLSSGTVSTDIKTTANVSATGNVTGGNVLTGGVVSATANITGGNILTAGLISATGNVTGNYILGNGSQLTGIVVSGAMTWTTQANTAPTGKNPGSFWYDSYTGVKYQYINDGTSNVWVDQSYPSSFSTLAVSGNATVGGTLAVTGTLSYGNVTTAGIVSATGNVTGGNILTAGIVSATGNITTAGNFIGNGALLTGLPASYSNSNVATFLASFGSNTISTTGNITASYIIGNGSQLTGLPAGYTNANVATYLSSGTVSTDIKTTANISATGNITGGNLSVGTGTVTVGNIVNSNGNGVGNIGSSSLYFNTAFVKATSAQYADLAEMYVADQDYMPGTVVEFGGEYEIRASQQSHSTRTAGIISTNPSYLMNSAQEGEFVLAVALTGRVPCQVIGKINKGDRLVAGSLPGVAEVLNMMHYQPGCIIGKALENYDSNQVGVIEVAVGRT